MKKLYKSQKGRVIAYYEAWTSGGSVVEHWGTLGETGQSEEHEREPGRTDEEELESFLLDARDSGFEPIGRDDHTVVQIGYAVEGMGNKDDLAKRHALQERMDELLGWTGLGHCDGGSIGTGTMEVCCLVVDFPIAKRVIEADLRNTRFADYTRVYAEEAG